MVWEACLVKEVTLLVWGKLLNYMSLLGIWKEI